MWRIEIKGKKYWRMESKGWPPLIYNIYYITFIYNYNKLYISNFNKLYRRLARRVPVDITLAQKTGNVAT